MRNVCWAGFGTVDEAEDSPIHFTPFPMYIHALHREIISLSFNVIEKRVCAYSA